MGKKNKPHFLVREKQLGYKTGGNTITISKIEKVVEKVVNRKLQELLGDPDYGLKLREEFQEKLDLVLKKEKETIPEKEIARKYGVEL